MNKNNFKILITFVILTFLFLSQGYSNILKQFDLNVISYIQNLENEWLTKFYKMITIITDTYQSTIITILLVALLYIKKYYREALFLTVMRPFHAIA